MNVTPELTQELPNKLLRELISTNPALMKIKLRSAKNNLPGTLTINILDIFEIWINPQLNISGNFKKPGDRSWRLIQERELIKAEDKGITLRLKGWESDFQLKLKVWPMNFFLKNKPIFMTLPKNKLRLPNSEEKQNIYKDPSIPNFEIGLIKEQNRAKNVLELLKVSPIKPQREYFDLRTYYSTNIEGTRSAIKEVEPHRAKTGYASKTVEKMNMFEIEQQTNESNKISVKDFCVSKLKSPQAIRIDKSVKSSPPQRSLNLKCEMCYCVNSKITVTLRARYGHAKVWSCLLS